MLFMKGALGTIETGGVPATPASVPTACRCPQVTSSSRGAASRAGVQILNAVDTPFEAFGVLSDQAIRQGIKEYSNWPTIPQVYVDGEFIGGCDVMIEMYQSGELREMLEVASAS